MDASSSSLEILLGSRLGSATIRSVRPSSLPSSFSEPIEADYPSPPTHSSSTDHRVVFNYGSPRSRTLRPSPRSRDRIALLLPSFRSSSDSRARRMEESSEGIWRDPERLGGDGIPVSRWVQRRLAFSGVRQLQPSHRSYVHLSYLSPLALTNFPILSTLQNRLYTSSNPSRSNLLASRLASSTDSSVVHHPPPPRRLPTNPTLRLSSQGSSIT